LRCCGLGGSFLSLVMAIRRGGGAFGGLQSGGNRAPLRLIAEIAGAAAFVVAFTGSLAAQSSSDFINSIDPLFAGVLARPGI